MAKVLGKGLEALIKMHDTEENNRYLAGQILIDKIIPNKEQPRQSFDDNKMQDLKKSIEKNFDYVGDSFAEEAKKIKYGEAKDRPIYGEATIEQTKELLDEEINVEPLPFAPKRKTN